MVTERNGSGGQPSPLSHLIKQLELHSKLTTGSKSALIALPFQMRALEAGEYILREGDRPTACAVLVSGFAYRQKETWVGKRQIVSLHNPGEALDLQQMSLVAADHSLRMLTSGHVAFIEHRHILQLMASHHNVTEAVFRATLIEASIFREWVLNVGRRDARSRIAHFLCEFAMRLERSGHVGDDGYVLPMTQEQLADTTGLTTVHINRTLKALAAEGLVTANVPSTHLDRCVGSQRLAALTADTFISINLRRQPTNEHSLRPDLPSRPADGWPVIYFVNCTGRTSANHPQRTPGTSVIGKSSPAWCRPNPSRRFRVLAGGGPHDRTEQHRYYLWADRVGRSHGHVVCACNYEAAARTTTGGGAIMARLQVLHIDDDDFRDVAAFSLAIDSDIDVRSVAAGAETLDALDAGYRPDVILLDVMMPRLDDPGILALIRERPEHGVIIKPFDPMALAKDVRALLARGP